MPFDTIPPLERFTEVVPLTAILGLRFSDATTGERVSADLLVEARPQDSDFLWTTAVRTNSGNWSFLRLPRVSTDSAVGSRPFVVLVRDRASRFLPTTFLVDLPLAESGIYQPTALEEGEVPAGIYLYAAPNRKIQSGWGVVRASLLDISSSAPAAHAVAELTFEDDSTVYGVADERGELLIAFPYPRFGMPLDPDAQGGSILDQEWPFTLRVRYQPNALVTPTWSGLPDYFSIFNQGPAHVYPADVAETQWDLTLSYQRELVLRTEGFSELRVEP